MFQLIHKYLDLETTDRLCYVGDEKGSFADKIVNRSVLHNFRQRERERGSRDSVVSRPMGPHYAKSGSG